MAAETPLMRRLQEGASAFSRQQRTLARHLLSNHQSVAFATISELADQAHVSEATIVRFAKALGFSGYAALQNEIRRAVRAELRGSERFRLGASPSAASATALEIVIEKERENIAALQEGQNPKTFARALQMLQRATSVLVVGARSAAPLAYHLWFALSKLGIEATRALAVTSETYDLVSRMEEPACVVVIGFPRYLREQTELLEFVKQRRIATLTITDSAFSPLQGDVSLYAPAESASFVAFHCAPLILVNALVHELSVDDGARTLEALDRFEAVAESRRYFVRH